MSGNLERAIEKKNTKHNKKEIIGESFIAVEDRRRVESGMGEYKEGYREFKGKEEFPSNVFYTTVALFIWLGIIHFIVLLVLFTVFFLPLTKSLM